jgi:signal transduction histidine kinase
MRDKESTRIGRACDVPDSGRPLWLQRSVLLAALALMIWALTAHRGGAGLHRHGLYISIALTVASACWLAWVLLGPDGNTPALVALTAGAALSGSVLLVLYPSLAVYWFTFWGCVSAGIQLSSRAGILITSGSVAILLAGWAAGQTNILGAFAAAAFVGYVLGRNRQHYLRIASQAATTERDRIARELHDVIGHSLTGVSLQIESAAAALETQSDPSAALSYLERAGELVRTGQHEAVAAVATISPEESDGDLAASIAALISRHRGDAAPTQFEVTGTQRPLPGPAALALYRVTQEALTNAAKHGSQESVQVQLEYGRDAVAVRVVNGVAPNGGAVGSGRGIAGMRNRMVAVGGTLTAGHSGNGWQVEARVWL